MPDLESLIAAVRAGDSIEARAAIRALAQLPDDRARSALGEALAGAGPLTPLEIQALGDQGAKALGVAISATCDSVRKLGGVALLGKLGATACCAQLRGWIADPDPLMRLTVASALYAAASATASCGRHGSGARTTWTWSRVSPRSPVAASR